jgi:hypothetical protein
MPLKIIAYPSSDPAYAPNLAGSIDSATRAIIDAGISGYSAVSGFTSLQDLVTRIIAIQARTRECVESLEIVAHGSAWRCDGLSQASAALWAQQFETIDWCGASVVYLSGCTTGCLTPQHTMGIAQLFSTFTPLTPARQVTVCGARGYETGMNADASMKVTQTCAVTDSNGVKQKLTPPSDSEDKDYPDAWRRFRSGVQV